MALLMAMVHYGALPIHQGYHQPFLSWGRSADTMPAASAC